MNREEQSSCKYAWLQASKHSKGFNVRCRTFLYQVHLEQIVNENDHLLCSTPGEAGHSMFQAAWHLHGRLLDHVPTPHNGIYSASILPPDVAKGTPCHSVRVLRCRVNLDNIFLEFQLAMGSCPHTFVGVVFRSLCYLLSKCGKCTCQNMFDSTR